MTKSLLPLTRRKIVSTLTDPEKREIVVRLARFEAIGDIVADFRERGHQLHHKQVGGYDPTKSYFDAGDWARELFNGTRRAYLEDVSGVPIANRGFRLNQLNDMFWIARQTRNWKLAADLLEQASKETGGLYSNVRDVNINDSRHQNPRDMSPEDRQQMMSELIRKALETMPRIEAELH